MDLEGSDENEGRGVNVLSLGYSVIWSSGYTVGMDLDVDCLWLSHVRSSTQPIQKISFSINDYVRYIPLFRTVRTFPMPLQVRQS